MATNRDPDEVLPYIDRVNSDLANKLRALKEGSCQQLYKKTRSFIGALQRSPTGQNTTYGPSINTILQVRDCYDHSVKLDGDRTSHFTEVLQLFLVSVKTLRELCDEIHSCIGENIMALTVHEKQRAKAEKIRSNIEFCRKYLEEDTDFHELASHKTTEKLRGLNTGEVSDWGAVLNLIPVIMSKFQDVYNATADWTSITRAERNTIFAPSKRVSSSRAGSRPGSRQSGGRNSSQAMKGNQTNMAQNQTKKPRKTYADRVDERNKGKISLLERPPFKPSSNPPHNLYPQLHIHLGDPTQHV
ncbi:uncharacterized protein LOC121411577 [Lytechinus variegatus]|uniref:uncharacterized protein LOC121411577 n=1 Tax=Lytechinus variegatus TaxID=7654 RepID=UPI001BB177B5|nr:uncharacterized protein LOC121411577 [Lytechinus variegatus]